MVFRAGSSGNPGGRPKAKDYTEALRIVGNEIDPATNKKKLRIMAEKIFELAIDGDVSAAREIGDRLEGKAIASLAINSPEPDVRDMPDSELIAIAAAGGALPN